MNMSRRAQQRDTSLWRESNVVAPLRYRVSDFIHHHRKDGGSPSHPGSVRWSDALNRACRSRLARPR
jgi:hypothetical protein